MPKAIASVDQLRAEYLHLYDTCLLVPSKIPLISAAATRIIAGKQKYSALQISTSVPWYVIGCIHYRESGCNFRTHLYNGDPLSHRTVHEPIGKPADIDPPYTFNDAATCALRDEHFMSWKDWSVEGMLYRWEAYNGWGYRVHEIHSPYLWGFSNQYSRGGFPKDHVWDDNYVSNQAGTAVIIKWMEVHGDVNLPAH